MLKQVKVAVIGAGQRGNGYASYALRNPHEIQIVAIADPDRERREQFQARHNISADQSHENWQDLLAQPKLADAVIICTQDRMHFAPAMEALQAGYHVMLEKPMSPVPAECIAMGQAAQEYDRIFLICHVLRYTPFFSTIKQLVDDGNIGRLISIQHNENVGYWHYGHSYVRGNWRNSDESSPMVLAKSCHDLDIILWLVGADCVNISSFGALTHFKAENAPKDAPLRCLDGCPVAESCQYYAPRLYLTGNDGWPASAISNDLSYEGLYKALLEGPYGRCVYHCDNNVVDHQVVNMEFANEVTAAFTMSAFTSHISRTLKLMGTRGEIRATMEKDEIEVTDFVSGTRHIIELNHPGGMQGHGGGDFGVMREFLQLVRNDVRQTGLTSASISVQSHLMAFAAEKARLEKKVINLQEYQQEIVASQIQLA
jgi:predicted dehydrogenase